MRRVAYIAFAAGSAVAITLTVIWRLVNAGKIPLTTSDYMRFSSITLYLWPSSLMLMEVDPQAPLNLERATLYATAILLNDASYAFVVAIFAKIGRALGR